MLVGSTPHKNYKSDFDIGIVTFVTQKGALRLAMCNASATRKGL